MSKNKRPTTQVVCTEKHGQPAEIEGSQKQITKVLTEEERAEKIKELKLNVLEKKLAENKKKLAENKEVLKERDTDNNEVCVPLEDDEKEMIDLWKERTKNAKGSPIIFTNSLDEKGNETGGIENKTGYPISETDMFNLWQASLNLATGAENLRHGYKLFSLAFSACGFLKPHKHKGEDITYVLEAMQALRPQDEIEGMLVSRLISLHQRGMHYLAVSSITETQEGTDININRSMKLMRLYSETLETLMRYRRRGEQKVTVTHQHVQVNDGGKAIVNNGKMNATSREIGVQ